MQERQVQSPGLGRFPGVGNGNPLQYSCLENSMDRGSWGVTVHGVAKSWAWLSTHACLFPLPPSSSQGSEFAIPRTKWSLRSLPKVSLEDLPGGPCGALGAVWSAVSGAGWWSLPEVASATWTGGREQWWLIQVYGWTDLGRCSASSPCRDKSRFLEQSMGLPRWRYW